MPYTGTEARSYFRENRFFLFTGRSFGKAKVQNLIIDCSKGELSGRSFQNQLFSVPSQLRVLFYCVHGTAMMPYIASPIPLMQGSFEACEVLSESQICFNYTLSPREAVEGLGTIENMSKVPTKIYKSIIEADRIERLKTGETRTANVYDILVPTNKVHLKRLLTEVRFRFPHYRNIHCLFSREISGRGRQYYDPYTLPSRFVQGQLGHWELLEENDADFNITDSWVFIEMTDANDMNQN
ncbi:hypothetical protein NX722_04315 [Endozoicomonas gorgoniicola]|uniref:Putative adhesin Stv domain-containing protein n=1 Tax=Endozoicomonas gorgoniicola TaxID=1234144 RepID=A0ABT3MR94_9GAMM|nr:hypothetical protein [Endozoicomonas gorgoniicola]MCW7551877.1 hypothetical protein [Endozoicomonas gorgoniicola]